MKTVNLELSKELKAAGYPQNISKFMWQVVQIDEKYTPEVFFLESEESTARYSTFYASPTADETLDQLPMTIQPNNRGIGHLEINRYNQTKGFWGLWYKQGSGEIIGDSIGGESLADAAAKMWLYLKKENLLEDKTS